MPDAPLHERLRMISERLFAPLRNGDDPDECIRCIERVHEVQWRAQLQLEALDEELRQKEKALAEREAKVALRERYENQISETQNQHIEDVGLKDTADGNKPTTKDFYKLLNELNEVLLLYETSNVDPDEFIRCIERVHEFQWRAQLQLEALDEELRQKAKALAEREAKVALREQQHAASERLPRQQTEAPAANVIQVASGEPNEIASGQQSYDVPLAGNTKMYLWAAVVLIAVLFFINQGGDDKRTYNPCRERPTSDECDSWLIWRGGDLYDTECLGGTRC